VLENDGRFEAMRSVPPAVAGGLLPNKIAGHDEMFRRYGCRDNPPATAGGTDLIASQSPMTEISKAPVAHINLLHCENYAHCVRTTIQRGGYKGRALSQGNFEVSEHLPIAWRLHHVR
jgi:hypothetical protein